MDITIDISLPKSWTDLTQQQLRFLLAVIASVNRINRNVPFRSQDDYAAQTAAQVATICLFKWSGITVICPYADGYLVKADNREVYLPTQIITAALVHLSWTKQLPQFPVRLDTVDGAKAIPADISSGLSFDAWLACETFWQQYQASQNPELLRQMAEILYNKEGIRPGPAATLGVFYWWAGVKNMVSAMFPNFFRSIGPEGTPEPIAYDTMRHNIDTQIRALTKGDITKESEILALNALRALTELDAQAREYDELQKKYGTT
ncbi:hypothetical protein [Muribaculum intestinale]|uniref:hypothetical protein n=1 Tax=Muribaculum intestinale TaxID=1796646 RepID=UPI0025A5F585|nr:hypothetical protein [Muribaculum intestinale]